MQFISDEHAAERLGISPRSVKHLRLTGRLAFIPGHPALIFMRSLEAYAEKRVSVAEVRAEVAADFAAALAQIGAGETTMLLPEEAGALLCASQRRMKSLRLSGQIAYLPGRPVLIDARHLWAFINAQFEAQEARRRRHAGPDPGSEEYLAAARRRAKELWQLRRIIAENRARRPK